MMPTSFLARYMENISGLYFVLVCCVAIGCTNHPPQRENVEEEIIQSQKINTLDGKNSVDVDGLESGYRDLRFIGSLSYSIGERDSVCSGWNLTPNEIMGVLSKLKQVEGSEWVAKCYTLPCSYTGKLADDNKSYKIEINAASHAVLYTRNEVLYFIAEDHMTEFLSPCDCCE